MLVNGNCEMTHVTSVQPWDYEYHQRNYPPPAYDDAANIQSQSSYSPQTTMPWGVTSHDDVISSSTGDVIATPPANSTACCRSGYCYQQQTVTNSNYTQFGQQYSGVSTYTNYDVTPPSGYHAHRSPTSASSSRHQAVTSAVKKSRKRNGMSVNVNTMLENLRSIIPTSPSNRRLSKAETLRLAVSYIKHLDATLSMDNQSRSPLSQDSATYLPNIASFSNCSFNYHH